MGQERVDDYKVRMLCSFLSLLEVESDLELTLQSGQRRLVVFAHGDVRNVFNSPGEVQVLKCEGDEQRVIQNGQTRILVRGLDNLRALLSSPADVELSLEDERGFTFVQSLEALLTTTDIWDSAHPEQPEAEPAPRSEVEVRDSSSLASLPPLPYSSPHGFEGSCLGWGEHARHGDAIGQPFTSEQNAVSGHGTQDPQDDIAFHFRFGNCQETMSWYD